MGKGGGGGGSTTTVQKADPWVGQQPYLTGGKVDGQEVVGVFPEAYKLYQNGGLAPDYYPGETLAPMDTWSEQALQMQADRALNGDVSISTAKGALDNITSGNALANNAGMNALNNLAGTDYNAGNKGLATLEQMTSAVNPYSSALLNDAIGSASANIDSGFSGAGRYGSGAHENAKADSVADLTSAFYSDAYDKQMQAANAAGQQYLGGLAAQTNAAQQAGQLYNTGIGQQVVAGNAAQDLANQAYTDAAMLSEAGGVKEDFAQQKINAAIDRYNYEQQQPLTALSNYNALIQGNYGGTSTSTAKQDTDSGSKLGGVLGGASTGAALGSYGGPWGTAIGAGVGGLLGLFA